jgi:hypothetical protein
MKILDNYNRLIVVGSPVAYNYGGSVARGVVVDIKPYKSRVKYRWEKVWTGHTFFVKNTGGFISKVTNKNNLIVLCELI